MSMKDTFFSPEYLFSSDEGMQFAFALTAYDNNRDPIDDPSYGKVSAKIVSWGLGEGQSFNEGGYLSLHNCS